MQEIDKVLDEIDEPENRQQNEVNIQENELDYSKSTNVNEYKIKYNKQKGKKILLKFPKKIDKIRLNLQEEDTNINENNKDYIRDKNRRVNIDKEIPIMSVNEVDYDYNPKLNKFIKNKLETPMPVKNNEKLDKMKTIKQLKKLSDLNCVKTRYLTELWSKYFPKNTSMFTFSNRVQYCNYNLIIMILKDFNGEFFKNITYIDIKHMLINYYTPYFDSKSLVTKLDEKWNRERKSKYIDKFKSGELTLEQIIMDENYKITESDILIISYILNIPIVILYQSKNQLKTASFVKQSKFNYRYYVKATSVNMMYLYSYKKLLKFSNELVVEPLFSVIRNQAFTRFEDYIVKRIRKIKKKEFYEQEKP